MHHGIEWNLRIKLLWKIFICFVFAIVARSTVAQDFTFAIIGDRTGDVQPGVYEKICQEVDRAKPAFAINVGDTIQGKNDGSADREWAEIQPLLKHRFPLYLVPGNHDIWSDASERSWRVATKRAPFYSFDYKNAHFTVLDNSRTEDLSPDQMRFLERDLAAHRSARWKLVIFHRPFWLIPVMFRNSSFELHRIAKEYGVTHVVSGHSHRYGMWTLEGVTYLMMGSSGGHLRGAIPDDGWFFHWVEARVQGDSLDLIVHKLN